MENKKDIKQTIEEILEDRLPSVPFAMYDGLRLDYGEKEKQLREEIYREKNKEIKGWKSACIGMITAWILLIVGIGYFFINYEFATYTQDGTGLNNVNSGKQGDLTYESTSSDVETESE